MRTVIRSAAMLAVAVLLLMAGQAAYALTPTAVEYAVMLAL